MRTRPPDLAERVLIAALEKHWCTTDVHLDYLPVGAGSYHWRATGPSTPSLFVTVDDLDRKPFLGRDADTVYERQRRAFETAFALRQGGLEFVVAPLEGVGGDVLFRISRRYAVAVYPYLGAPRPFRKTLSDPERVALQDMLARLHAAKAFEHPATLVPPEVPLRRGLEDALGGGRNEWTRGRQSEAARSILAANAPLIRRWLDRFDELVLISAARNVELVITHGEPHSGNIVRSAKGFLLVDWDTVGLAPRERDLWMVGGGDPQLCELYRLRWRLDDLSSSVSVLQSRRGPDDETERALNGLRRSIDHEPFTRD